MKPAEVLTRRFGRSFTPLLVMLLVIQAAFPLVYTSPLASLALTAGLLAASVPAVRPSPRVRLVATVGLVVVLAIRIAVVHFDPEAAGWTVAAFLVTATYVAFVAVNVFSAVIRRTRVNANTVLGAICVYLLMAHVFAMVYVALQVHSPGSITGLASSATGTAGSPHSHLHDYLYFSVITLTTLGYGDMLAVTPTARALVMIEAMSGQFFVAVFVARLVGSWSSAVPPDDGDPAA
jgi:hypothetical protein